MDLLDVAVQLGFLQEALAAVVTLVPVDTVVVVQVTLKFELKAESCITNKHLVELDYVCCNIWRIFIQLL